MHLNTKKCPECGKTFTPNDIQSRLMTQEEALGTTDVNLYGGNAKRFAVTECCEKKYLLWLRPQSNTYKVLTISQTGEYRCGCGKTFDSEKGLQMHRVRAHKSA